MRKGILLSILILTMSLLMFDEVGAEASIYVSPKSNRVAININSDWRFYKADVQDAHATSFDDSNWSLIALPHTWNNLDGQDGGNDYYRGVGWYRKHLSIDSSYEGKRFYLQFEGANITADVFFNGHYLGQHRGGFTTFRFDVTPYANVGGDNLIAVKVNNAHDPDIPPLSADFTFFGGIYRDVHLLITNSLHIDTMDYGSSGVYLTQTNVSEKSADLQINSRIVNTDGTDKEAAINAVVVDASNTVIKTLSESMSIEGNSSYDFTKSVTISQPRLWNGLKDPYMYRVYVEVWLGDECVDVVSEPLGFRYFSVDPNKGFLLNGQPYDLHGVSRHQDRLDMGWAITQKEHDEDLVLIKELGATAVRLAHYPHAKYFYELCDENGLVVWAELPVVNRIARTEEFYNNSKSQLAELIRQNYNHPSIIFWSIGNEVSTNGGDPTQLFTQLHDLAKKEDPSRLTVYASVQNASTNYNWITDVVAFNRYYGWYESFSADPNDFADWADRTHANYPKRCIGVSEFGGGASIYFHSSAPALNDHTEEYQNLLHEAHWLAMKERPYLWCKFIWNMFDFAVDGRDEGDTKGRNDKGLVTYDRQVKKDSFYWYKANWSDEPFAYITSRRYELREDPVTQVKIYSNCDSVELKVNGTSLGSKTSDNRIFIWEGVRLVNGENTVEAVGMKDSMVFTDACKWQRLPNDDPTLGSDVCSFDHAAGIITSVPADISLDEFVNYIIGPKYGSFKVLQADGKELTSGKVMPGMKVVSTSETGVDKVYTIVKSSRAEISSEKCLVDNEKQIIAGIPAGTTVQKLESLITLDVNASFKVYESDGTTEVVKGAVELGMVIEVTAQDGTKMRYSVAKGPLSLGKSVRASSNEAGNLPANASDGDISTRWAASKGSYPQWWRVDLGDVYNLDRFEALWFNRAPGRSYQYTVEVSSDDKKYDVVIDRSNNTAQDLVVDELSAVGRYVRVTITGGQGFASAYEFVIYGGILSSSIFTVDDVDKTIVVPEATTIDSFKRGLKLQKSGVLKVYKSDGKTEVVKGNIEAGMILVIAPRFPIFSKTKILDRYVIVVK